MKHRKIIILLVLVFSVFACFLSYAYWTDKLDMKFEVKVNYPVQMVIEEKAEDEQEATLTD